MTPWTDAMQAIVDARLEGVPLELVLPGGAIEPGRLEAVLARLEPVELSRIPGWPKMAHGTPCYLCGSPEPHETDYSCLWCHRPYCGSCFVVHGPSFRCCARTPDALPDHIPLPMRKAPLPFRGCHPLLHPTCAAQG